MARTLEEVAKLAGVSRSTVSRVVNDHPNVRPEVRERVWKVIEEVDYHPNRAARSLASRRSKIVGLVIPREIHAVFSDPYFPILTEGIARACNEHNYALVLGLITPEMQNPYRRLVRGGLLDGVIVTSAVQDDPFVARLLQDDFPFVLVGRSPQHDGVSYVDVDNISGARTAVQHLARLGYRRIATIAGPSSTIAGQDRHAGYQMGLRSAGLAYDPDLVVEGDFSEMSGQRGMQALLALESPPDAVFAASDMMAIGALKVMRAVGLRVPEDVALVGFDDIPLSALVDPPLTTVRQSISDLGYTAATLLFEELESEDSEAQQRLILPTELVIRSSCRRGL
jgi:LacI family transcriptional regulator